MKPRTTRFLLLVVGGVTALLSGLAALRYYDSHTPPDEATVSRPAQQESTAAHESADWFSVRNSEGLSFLTRRRPGIDHLIVYAGFGANGVAELNAEAHRFADAGFNIITHRRRLPDPDGKASTPGTSAARAAEDTGADRPPLNENELREFLGLSTSRPGYRKRLLVLPGSRLAEGLEFLAGAPRSVATVIVLRPGDALRDRARVLKSAALLPEELRVLWVASIEGREGARALRLQAALRRARVAPELKLLRLRTLSLPRGPQRSGFRLALSETLYYEVLLERLAPVWHSATKVFAGGCGPQPGYPSAYFAANAEVSATPDRDFCPLFLRRPDTTLYRAEEIRDDGSCMYRRADSRARLYCEYTRE